MPKVKYNMVYSKIQKCLGKISIISGNGFHPFPLIMNIFANQFGFFEKYFEVEPICIDFVLGLGPPHFKFHELQT